EEVLASRYEEIRQEIDTLTKDSYSVFRVNLTSDEVEVRRGAFLYVSDLEHDRYSELIAARMKNVIDPDMPKSNKFLFTREGLLKVYHDGQTNASEEILIRRRDGVICFVRLEATLIKKPGSGDVVAFIVERPCNESIVREALLKKVLMDHYDRIAYIIDGQYKVVISNAGRREGLLLQDDEEDTYESIYLNVFLPAMDKSARGGKNPLRLSVIEEELLKNGKYELDAPFRIGGTIRYKHFSFYLIDKYAHFYLMLLHDSTHAVRQDDPLPEEPKETAEPETLSGETGPEETSYTVARTYRLLVVDDNEVNRELAALILTSDGNEVTLAEDGAEAVKTISESPSSRFDAVLMDVNMPVMNGYEATKAIRGLEDPMKSRIPIVAMTANAFAEDEKAALDAGMNGFTAKPIDPKAIYSILNTLVED
ncbi:MAG: response regulator, partial [Lachnospiraceae bacterium]|nr:response regulator [Lachnospiraceae bacterium]